MLAAGRMLDGDAPLLEDGLRQDRQARTPWLAAAASMAAVASAFWAGCTLSASTAGVAVSLHVRSPGMRLSEDPLGGFGAPLAKRIVLAMDTNINLHANWANWKAWSMEMTPYWAKDMTYDFNFVGPWGFGPQHGLRAWFDGEHMHFNRALPDCQWQDFIRAATNQTCTSASYGIGRWSGLFADVPPPTSKPWVKVRDLDFYLMEGDRIKINWCIIDVVDLFMQVGYNVLPQPPMSTDGYLAPFAMDGFPAPVSAAVDTKVTISSEEVWRAALQEDYVLNNGDARWWAEDTIWYGPGGVGTAHSRRELVTHFLRPLHAAFSNLTMAVDVIVCEGNYCGAHFYLHGLHSGTWLGQEATGKAVPIRCGAHARILDGKIVQGWLIIDVPRAFHAMGVDLYARARKIALEKDDHMLS